MKFLWIHRQQGSEFGPLIYEKMTPLHHEPSLVSLELDIGGLTDLIEEEIDEKVGFNW